MIDPASYNNIIFFTGAGMSAESGVPTYRGRGGIWHEYNYEDYACQEAFEKSPEKVLDFHELRRKAVLRCNPHEGHRVITALQQNHPRVTMVTQNIDGMHQRSGSTKVLELHGSLWRLRCSRHGIREDLGKCYARRQCEHCKQWLRPDIVWFGDMLNGEVIHSTVNALISCDLFISIGTSAVVYPAAGYPKIARENGAYCIEINPEETPISNQYHKHLREPASRALKELFPNI